MNESKGSARDAIRLHVLLGALLATSLTGCVPNYYQLRRDGQRAMLDNSYGVARHFFLEAERFKPRRVENYYDLGTCAVMLARNKFKQRNQAAAMRELDSALAAYNQALDIRPSHQPSIEGKNTALELKGQFDEALRHAEWAAEFVGPSARQYVYLANELEERGDVDGAFLRLRQAVAMEPDSADAHVAFAKFLLRHRNEPAAIEHLQTAYRLDPLNDWVVDQLAARGAVPPLAGEDVKTP